MGPLLGPPWMSCLVVALQQVWCSCSVVWEMIQLLQAKEMLNIIHCMTISEIFSAITGKFKLSLV